VTHTKRRRPTEPRGSRRRTGGVVSIATVKRMSPGKYSSTLRAEQAAQTRQRVVAAAAERFAADSFARTTLSRLAAEAGVSVETVQAQGSKRSPLTAAVHHLTFGDSDVNFFSAPEARASIEAAS
jgi:hypothetical protein